MAGKTVEVKCERCQTPFTARVADRKRGWGRFCSKSCKAIRQEQRTGQYAAYIERTITHPHFGPEPVKVFAVLVPL